LDTSPSTLLKTSLLSAGASQACLPFGAARQANNSQISIKAACNFENQVSGFKSKLSSKTSLTGGTFIEFHSRPGFPGLSGI